MRDSEIIGSLHTGDAFIVQLNSCSSFYKLLKVESYHVGVIVTLVVFLYIHIYFLVSKEIRGTGSCYVCVALERQRT